jgi:adenylate cyclase
MQWRKWQMRLRPTLLTTIIGLVLVTAISIGAAAAILMTSITRTLIHQGRGAAVSVAREEMRQLFSTPPRVLSELVADARRSVLVVDNREQLAAAFAERLRALPRLSFIGYGSTAGWYVGAGRYAGGEIVEYIADPKINGGVPMQTAVTADGDRSTPSVAETEPYSAPTRPWYIKGIAHPGPVWTDFHPFVTGGDGITCMIRFTPLGKTEPAGVFHADLRIEGVEAFLSELRIGDNGAVFLVDGGGQRRVTPTGEHIDWAAAAVDATAPQRAHNTLKHPGRAHVAGSVYEVIFEPVPTEGDIGLSIAVAINLADISAGAFRHTLLAGSIGVLTVLLAALFGRALSTRIARPIVAIAADLGRVGSFEISRDPAPRSFVREVSELGRAVDRMKASLRSFAHYVPTDVVRTLLAHGKEAELGVELRRLTMFFSDIANFTTISEGMEPTRLVAEMGRYFELVTAAITEQGGTVDKFMGDGIMAFFNAPAPLARHQRHACLAALATQRRLAERHAALPAGAPVFRTRIGLGLGEVLVGNIGTPDRFAYTLLGDEVNLASRLEGLNKIYGTTILASDAVVADAGHGFAWRRLDRVAVKGRQQGTDIFELIGMLDAVPPARLAARDLYEAALKLYFAGDFPAAADGFDAAAQAAPDDLAAVTMRERCHDLGEDPPAGWQGIKVMEQK